MFNFFNDVVLPPRPAAQPEALIGPRSTYSSSPIQRAPDHLPSTLNPRRSTMELIEFKLKNPNLFSPKDSKLVKLVQNADIKGNSIINPTPNKNNKNLTFDVEKNSFLGSLMDDKKKEMCQKKVLSVCFVDGNAPGGKWMVSGQDSNDVDEADLWNSSNIHDFLKRDLIEPMVPLPLLTGLFVPSVNVYRSDESKRLVVSNENKFDIFLVAFGVSISDQRLAEQILFILNFADQNGFEEVLLSLHRHCSLASSIEVSARLCQAIDRFSISHQDSPICLKHIRICCRSIMSPSSVQNITSALLSLNLRIVERKKQKESDSERKQINQKEPKEKEKKKELDKKKESDNNSRKKKENKEEKEIDQKEDGHTKKKKWFELFFWKKKKKQHGKNKKEENGSKKKRSNR